MTVYGIEVAIECDDPLDEGVIALNAMVTALGLDITEDVRAVQVETEGGTMAVVALIQLGIAQSSENAAGDAELSESGGE